MQGKIDENLLKRIELLPESALARGDKAKRNASIASALKVMEVGKAIVYSEEEFFKEFGKHGIASLTTALRNNGIKKPLVTLHKEKVYIANRAVV